MSNGDLRTQSYGGDGTGLLGVQEGVGGAVSTGSWPWETQEGEAIWQGREVMLIVAR